MRHNYRCHRCNTFGEVTTVGSADLCGSCLTAQYQDRISTMAFDLLLLKLEIEEKDKEIRKLMVDKIELSCELAQVNSG